MNDAAVRRQLRFALFLQAFAVLMLGATAVIRIVAFGFDAVSAVLLVAVLLVLGAGLYTLTRLSTLASEDSSSFGG